jgi:uncharacterized protein YkwD
MSIVSIQRHVVGTQIATNLEETRMSVLAAPRRSLALLSVVLIAVAAAGCMPADARTFLERTNAMRSSAGVAPLAEHDALTQKAEEWAQHMADTGVLAHSKLTRSLDGVPWLALGENVAMSSPTADTLATLQELLAGSSQHRANLLSDQFTHLGVGVATGADGRVWVAEVFARL